jgi:hypothetical protein
MIEEFRDIKGYEGYYQVSNLGNFKSLDRYIKYSDRKPVFVKGKSMNPSIKTNGYLSVMLTLDGTHKRYFVHRIVYLTFKDEINKSLEINHIDGNKKNNRLENLEAITHKENIAHAHRLGLMNQKRVRKPKQNVIFAI